MKQNIVNVLILYCIVIFISKSVIGQNDTIKFNNAYLNKYWTDTKSIVTSPVRWQTNDLLKAGIILSTVGGSMFADQSVNDFAQAHQTNGLSEMSSDVLEPFGSEYSLIFLSGIYIYGASTKNARCKSSSLLALESFVLASLLVRIPKNLAGRQRPDNWRGDGPFSFFGPLQGNSFPSGHTTASFAIASVFANQYRDTKWVPVATYTVATLVGLSRIYDNKHWLSDVIAGAVVGTLVGNLVSNRKDISKISVIPFKEGGFTGLKLAYNL